MSDPVAQLAIEHFTDTGTPLANAAAAIASEQEASRQAVLAAHEAACAKARRHHKRLPPLVLDPALFPPEVFDAQGHRRSDGQGRPVLTPVENRAAWEREDARRAFS